MNTDYTELCAVKKKQGIYVLYRRHTKMRVGMTVTGKFDSAPFKVFMGQRRTKIRMDGQKS